MRTPGASIQLGTGSSITVDGGLDAEQSSQLNVGSSSSVSVRGNTRIANVVVSGAGSDLQLTDDLDVASGSSIGVKEGGSISVAAAWMCLQLDVGSSSASLDGALIVGSSSSVAVRCAL